MHQHTDPGAAGCAAGVHSPAPQANSPEAPQHVVRNEEHRIGPDREEAEIWMHRRDAANRALSPAWKAAREAEIQRAAAAGPGGTGCYFLDQADRDRAALNDRSAR